MTNNMEHTLRNVEDEYNQWARIRKIEGIFEDKNIDCSMKKWFSNTFNLSTNLNITVNESREFQIKTK